MHVRTLLNKLEVYKSFVFCDEHFEETEGSLPSILVNIRPRKGARGQCPECGRLCATYDTQRQRRFEYKPLFEFKVFFVYTPRRVKCPFHGVKVESVPWGSGKEQMTNSYKHVLSRWAKRLSWQETARIFETSWDSVYRAVESVVSYGMQHQELDDISQIGVDEIAVFRGHKYLSMVYALDEGKRRLLWCGEGRDAKVFRKFFQDVLGQKRSHDIQYVCSDMWAAYLKVTKEEAPNALNILDRFHIMKKFNDAIEQVRRDEYKALKSQGVNNPLIGARWTMVKRPENHTEKQAATMKELLKHNLKSVKAHLMREEFQRFWSYTYSACALKFMNEWITRTLRGNIEPMKKVARMLRRHTDLIMNWFKPKKRLSSGAVEGLNLKAKLVIRKSFGFRSIKCLVVALFHTLGNLPEPNRTHRFC